MIEDLLYFIGFLGLDAVLIMAALGIHWVYHAKKARARSPQ